MNEDAVRALVRDVIARHLSGAHALPRSDSRDRTEWAHHHASPRPQPIAWLASHARYGVLSGEEADGPCFIEPAVRCNHCGYCQSHGH